MLTSNKDPKVCFINPLNICHPQKKQYGQSTIKAFSTLAVFFLSTYSLIVWLTAGVKDEGSEEEMEDSLTDEKRAWDADNESEHVSAEDSTEDDATPVAEVADITAATLGRSDAPTDLRKRRPQESPNAPEET